MQDLLLGGGETGWCYPDLNCEVIHVSCTTLADPQRTPHRPALRRSPSRRQQTRLLVGVDRVGPTSTAAANSATRRPLTVVCRRVHTASVVTPDLDRRREENDHQGDQHGFGDGTEEETSEDGTNDRSSRHGEYEAFVGAKDAKLLSRL